MWNFLFYSNSEEKKNSFYENKEVELVINSFNVDECSFSPSQWSSAEADCVEQPETLHVRNEWGKEKPSHSHQAIPFNWLKSSHIQRPFFIYI